MSKKFALNKIGRNYQIYGDVNGSAIRCNSMYGNHYTISVDFFIESILVKCEMNTKDWTVNNEQKIIDRINKMVEEAKRDYL